MTKSEARVCGRAARSSLPSELRLELSRPACAHISASPQFRSAGVVLLYNAIGAELSLKYLEPLVGQRFVFPVCREDMTLGIYEGVYMRRGMYGITEPDTELCREISPDEVGLVICPCTAFDGVGHRTGMGAGYYDRLLPELTHAHIMCAAFEVQRVPCIEAEAHDFSMMSAATERGIICFERGRLP